MKSLMRRKTCVLRDILQVLSQVYVSRDADVSIASMFLFSIHIGFTSKISYMWLSMHFHQIGSTCFCQSVSQSGLSIIVAYNYLDVSFQQVCYLLFHNAILSWICAKFSDKVLNLVLLSEFAWKCQNIALWDGL